MKVDNVMATFQVKWQIYIAIVRALGGLCFAVMTACYMMYHVTSVTANYWLSQWTDDLDYHNVTSLPPGTADDHSSDLYLAVYGVLGAGQCKEGGCFCWCCTTWIFFLSFCVPP